MSGFVRLLLMNIKTSTVFYQNLISGRHIRFDCWWGVLATSSSVGSLVGFSVGSLVSSSVSSSVGSSSSSSSSSLLGSSGLGYRYNFITVVLKLVGLLDSYTLYISLLILSNLSRPIYLPLCLVLPSRHINISKLRGRLQIMVIDRLFRWFSILLTYFFTLILIISSITFFIAAACCIIDNTSGLSLLI